MLSMFFSSKGRFGLGWISVEINVFGSQATKQELVDWMPRGACNFLWGWLGWSLKTKLQEVCPGGLVLESQNNLRPVNHIRCRRFVRMGC